MAEKINDNKGLQQRRMVSVFAVRRWLNRGLASIGLLLALGVGASVYAGPWISPGDSALRSDILVLADAGLITAPVSTWPLAWGDIAASLDGSIDELSPYELAAWARLRRRADAAMVTGSGVLSGYASLAEHPRQIRTFEDGPREEAEIGIGYEWTGDWFAASLQGQWVNDPLDGDEWRADGSYLGVALGNWMFAAGATDRWWGPGWQSSVILSSNARPIPAFTLERNSTKGFETKWLSWIGDWDLAILFGFLESDREVPNAQVFGMRFNVKPLKWLEIGFSRLAMWCGDGRPCGLDTFIDLLLGKDNRGDNVSPEDEPGNQLGGYDIRLSGSGLGWPVAIYFERIGEDEQDFLPSLFLNEIGLETWGQWAGLGEYRIYLEMADTLCGGNLTGSGTPNCAYNHPIYQTGVRYKGRSIAHSLDNDAKVFTLGGVLTDEKDRSWVAAIAYGDLNRVGAEDPRNTVAIVKTRYREVELSHRRSSKFGDFNIGMGYEMRENTVSGENDDNFRVYLEWSNDF